ncbi:MAG: hypothetical protein IKO11_02625 [Lachnospiraceae bacterium]|nr:hypothetical protein [Lachnospiraceae bacterium]
MKKYVKTVIIMLVVVGILVGFYLFLSRRNEKETSTEATADRQVRDMTATQKLIAEAAYKPYPVTPVQVLKYYNEIQVCFYNEEYSEEELKQLGDISRRLMDDELVAQQTEEQFYAQLKLDVANLKAQGDHGTTIYDIEVTPSMDVEYFDHEGDECARLYNSYTMKQMIEGKLYYPVIRYVYVMRRDKEGHWKILGFKKDEEGSSGTERPLAGS